jgi:transcriptional regulator with XRE-family HTH domain
MTPAQCRAARGLLKWGQDDLASAASVSAVTIRNFENEKSSPQRASLAMMVRALEAAGVEFTNGDRPGVRMKSYKLKDAGKDAFLMDPLVKWIGFGAVDAGRMITVRVEDIALQRLDPTAEGANQMSVLATLRGKIFNIAAEKYEVGLIEPGEIISVTDADVAQQLR